MPRSAQQLECCLSKGVNDPRGATIRSSAQSRRPPPKAFRLARFWDVSAEQGLGAFEISLVPCLERQVHIRSVGLRLCLAAFPVDSKGSNGSANTENEQERHRQRKR